MGLLSSLKREQKEAVALLQVGTFLEYFDLMLYVHMAVLLNELFFPKTDPHTASLLTAFAFCSTYVMRPLGALVFGYIGDHIGRKTTVMLTTLMMSFSCLFMANLPTYARIGITATWLITLCRIFQGLSSMGEIIGASIYLTEITKPPVRYFIVSLITIFSSLGGFAALAVASIVLGFGFDWRYVFWFGVVIALIGTAARTRLRETPDFVDMKRRMNVAIENAKELGLTKAAELLKKTNPIWKEKVNKKVAIAYFLMDCSWPLWFYLIYVYCSDFLKNQMGLSAKQIIHQNLIVSIFQFLGFALVSFMSYKVHPLKILQVKQWFIFPLILAFPVVFLTSTSSQMICAFQCLCAFCCFTTTPAYAVICVHFPVFKRFTYSSFIFAFTRAFVYILTSFGLVYLTDMFGYWGVLIISMPIFFSFEWGLRYFKQLEGSGVNEEFKTRPVVFENYARLRAASH